MRVLAILGAGSWGTALSIVLAPRFEEIRLWAHKPELAALLRTRRENEKYLPGFPLPSNVVCTSKITEAVRESSVVLGVMPSQYARGIYRDALPDAPRGTPVVSATKGFERGTLLRMSEVIGESTGSGRGVAVLSGPTFALEVARGDPAALAVASADRALAAGIQAAFSGPRFRLYTNSDVAGVETGAAVKNVIAIAAGVCSGLGLGNNAAAALVTRGLAEITRLAAAVGGRPSTLAGLAGLGDLVLTCGGDLSRNRQVGLELARGRPLGEILASMTMVAEGVETTFAAEELSRRWGVEMPITREVAAILRGERSPAEALRDLMERNLKDES